MDLTGPDFSTAAYWTEFDERGGRLIMPIRRGWKAIGGAVLVFAFAKVQHSLHFGRDWDLFDMALVLFVIVTGMLLLVELVTSLFAREVLRIEGLDLVHGWHLLGLRREARYPVHEIRNLARDDYDIAAVRKRLISPLKDFGKVGAVRFDSARGTVHVGLEMDEAHAEGLLRWLAARLPVSARAA